MFRISEVVKHLIILNVLMYVLTATVFVEFRPLLAMHFGTGYFQPFQLVSHMFMHANTQHLIFNMVGLFMFGTNVEHALGPKKFLFLYFASGFGALGLHLLALTMTIGFGAMLGASGAVFGVLGAYGILFSNEYVNLIFPPIPVKGLILVGIFATMEVVLGFGRTSDGVAHFAHIGGAFFGVLLLLYWEKRGFR